MDARFDSDGITLAGTLTEVPDPVAAALLITGSGRINRDSDARLGRHGPMLLRIGVTRQVAEALAAAGVASLRYDKRGVGASEGDYRHAGMTENLADARAGLRWLAARYPGLPLITVGHSEGTYHAARLAAEEAVAGTILLAAPARTGEQITNWQIQKLEPTLPKAARVIMRLTGRDFVRTQHKHIARLKASDTDVIRMQGIRVNARWYREFFSYDPKPALASTTAPLLATARPEMGRTARRSWPSSPTGPGSGSQPGPSCPARHAAARLPPTSRPACRTPPPAAGTSCRSREPARSVRAERTAAPGAPAPPRSPVSPPTRRSGRERRG